MKVLLVVMVLCQLLLSDAMASIQSRTADGPLKEKGDDSVGLSVNNTELHQAYTRSRRSVSNHPENGCYKQFFVGGEPPRGFHEGHGKKKYICQQVKAFSDDSFYATMFDEVYGIPIYAGYIVPKGHKDFGIFPRVVKWSQDPDIKKQGSNTMYQGSSNYDIHKGHLVPARTYSFNCLLMASTFRYTNAVPQSKEFNTGPWKRYENIVRQEYAFRCGKQHGDLYLLTGISLVKIVYLSNKEIKYIKGNLRLFSPNVPPQRRIVIPNSMWTAGCCVLRNNKVLGAFAAIGNNDKKKMPMKRVSVAELQNILKKGENQDIELFPKSGCANNN